MQAFLASEDDLAEEPLAPDVPAYNPRHHQREVETLKHHLAHRGQLSMSDMKSVQDRDRAPSRDRGKRGVTASDASNLIWSGADSSGPLLAKIRERRLREAMTWHEILLPPVSLRDPDGLS